MARLPVRTAAISRRRATSRSCSATSVPAGSATNFATSSSMARHFGQPARPLRRAGQVLPHGQVVFATQPQWQQKIEELSDAQKAEIEKMTDQQRIIRFAEIAGMPPDRGTLRGNPGPRSPVSRRSKGLWSDCSTSPRRRGTAGFDGTPTFLINGKMTDAATWEHLEPRAQGRPARRIKPWPRGGATGLRIRRLKLSGFKSFVESTELRVEPGLTGVVGPNGCGKSNLLEAIRWVMGEGSPKSLRGGGMDDVIFAGTATRPQRDFAEVSVLLDRDRRREARAGRKRGHPADRARRRVRLPHRRPRRPRQGRRLCCSPTRRPARIPRRWSARARSARSSRPSRSSGACCWRRRQAFRGFTRGARTPSRSFAQPRPISPGSARSSASRSSVRHSSGGRRAPPSATRN